jgi:thioredoxin reductase
MIDHLKGQLETTPTDCVAVDREMATSVQGVFAVGGLLYLHVKQAVVAADDGVMVAMAVSKYLHGRAQARPEWKQGVASV